MNLDDASLWKEILHVLSRWIKSAWSECLERQEIVQIEQDTGLFCVALVISFFDSNASIDPSTHKLALSHYKQEINANFNTESNGDMFDGKGKSGQAC